MVFTVIRITADICNTISYCCVHVTEERGANEVDALLAECAKSARLSCQKAFVKVRMRPVNNVMVIITCIRCIY